MGELTTLNGWRCTRSGYRYNDREGHYDILIRVSVDRPIPIPKQFVMFVNNRREKLRQNTYG